MKGRNAMLISLSIVLAGSYAYTLYGSQRQSVPTTVHTVESVKVNSLSIEPERSSATNIQNNKFQERCSMDWSADDAEILLKISMAEAEGENTEGKALVMLVVLNRMLSPEFPNTIKDVVFQENQFTTVFDGGRYWTTTPDDDCKAALKLIENGYDESQGALYFESVQGDSWHSRNLELLFQEGNHRFYK